MLVALVSFGCKNLLSKGLKIIVAAAVDTGVTEARARIFGHILNPIECSLDDGNSSLWMDEQAKEESCVLEQYESYTELAREIPFSAHVALYGNGQMIMDKN
ncbi:hypothetical protein SDJN03_27045, partial [Cucurbita argyrosperma subsp. sororia]